MVIGRKDRSLGVARKTRRYDLPLNKSQGSGFLVVLICLMSFLAVLALSASFALSAMTKRWSAGLENSATIEIPARSADGGLLSPEILDAQTSRIAAALRGHNDVQDIRILDDSEISELIRPWLGDSEFLKEVPLPGLIEVRLSDSATATVDALRDRIHAVSPLARLDTHEQWLTDLVRFTGALQFAAMLLVIVIGMITVIAIAGAIRSRMAVHHEEIELLHLMGAADRYIARQFQRHSLILALQGSLCGLLAGALALFVIGWISGEMGVNLLPDFRISPVQIMILAIVPLIISFIAVITARATVMRVLVQLP